MNTGIEAKSEEIERALARKVDALYLPNRVSFHPIFQHIRHLSGSYRALPVHARALFNMSSC